MKAFADAEYELPHALHSLSVLKCPSICCREILGHLTSQYQPLHIIWFFPMASAFNLQKAFAMFIFHISFFFSLIRENFCASIFRAYHSMRLVATTFSWYRAVWQTMLLNFLSLACDRNFNRLFMQWRYTTGLSYKSRIKLVSLG